MRGRSGRRMSSVNSPHDDVPIALEPPHPGHFRHRFTPRSTIMSALRISLPTARVAPAAARRSAVAARRVVANAVSSVGWGWSAARDARTG